MRAGFDSCDAMFWSVIVTFYAPYSFCDKLISKVSRDYIVNLYVRDVNAYRTRIDSTIVNTGTSFSGLSIYMQG